MFLGFVRPVIHLAKGMFGVSNYVRDDVQRFCHRLTFRFGLKARSENNANAKLSRGTLMGSHTYGRS